MFLPGVGLIDETWGPTVEAVAGRWPDASPQLVLLPGMGERAPRGADLSPRHLAHRALARCRDTDGPLVLLGHSAGCQVAAHAAVLDPDRVRALVLVGPSTDPRGSSWPALVARWLATARHERPGQIPALARQYTHTGVPSLLRNLGVARHDRVDRTLATTECPVLVVRGLHDHIAPTDWCDLLAAVPGPSGRAHPASRAVTLPGGGHMVPWSHPDALAAEVARFVADVERHAAGS